MKIAKSEGIPGLYSGISAAVARQLTYTTARLGLYDVIREQWAGSVPVGGQLSLLDKAVIGLSAGSIAAFGCCPVEVSLVRMQADASAALAKRRNYAREYLCQHLPNTLTKFYFKRM